MIFWITIGLMAVAIVVMALVGASDYEVAVGIGYGVLIAFLVALFGGITAVSVVSTSYNHSRVTESHELEKYDDGSYLHLTWIGSIEYLSFQEKIGGQVLAMTGEYDTYTVNTKDSGLPRLSSVQKYLDNGAIWPWVVEGPTSDVIYVNSHDISTVSK